MLSSFKEEIWHRKGLFSTVNSILIEIMFLEWGRGAYKESTTCSTLQGKRKLRWVSRLESQAVDAPASKQGSRTESLPLWEPSLLWLPVVKQCLLQAGWSSWLYTIRCPGQSMQACSATPKGLPPVSLSEWAEWTLAIPMQASALRSQTVKGLHGELG